MPENAPAGGAGPALAAHSKDGSAPGPTSASSAMGNKGESGGPAENLRDFSEKASEGVERLKASVRGNAREALARENSRDRAADFVRDQPLVAMAVTGAICMAFGVLLGRR